ncbi:hypothetical protein NM208_g1108 [Fusarium decemcellulare]|uniref:Uncharacterized protein n=1 Tax=Fusarium decemcellulare TaxID=57161 RepID=A0ACC1SX76_9HYPO|nr:hypothetical protein NM208_g1108 [Fusarium decemcellulare]
MSDQQLHFFNITRPRDCIAHVEINRPQKLNAFVEPLYSTNSQRTPLYVPSFYPEPAKKLLTGLDLQAASQEGSIFNPTPQDIQDVGWHSFAVRKWLLKVQECISSIEACEKPVICVLHGAAYGLAIDIATCADIRICTADAALSVKEVDVGLASDAGTLTRLPRIVGSDSWVKEVCLTARVFGAEEARRVGFVSDIGSCKIDAVEKAISLAETVASKSPIAVQGTKNFLDWCRNHDVPSEWCSSQDPGPGEGNGIVSE